MSSMLSINRRSAGQSVESKKWCVEAALSFKWDEAQEPTTSTLCDKVVKIAVCIHGSIKWSSDGLRVFFAPCTSRRCCNVLFTSSCKTAPSPDRESALKCRPEIYILVVMPVCLTSQSSSQFCQRRLLEFEEKHTSLPLVQFMLQVLF